MLAETCKIPGAGASSVNRRGDSRFTAEFFRVNTKRRAAPIDMGVKVDKSWCHDVTGHVPHGGAGIGLQSRPDPRNLALREAYIDYLVELLGGVDDASFAKNKVICHSCGPAFPLRWSDQVDWIDATATLSRLLQRRSLSSGGEAAFTNREQAVNKKQT